MRLPARKDTRFAGDVSFGPQEWWSNKLEDRYMTPGRPFDTQTFALDTHMLPQNVKDFAARYPSGIQPEGSFDADRAASEIMAAAARNFSGDGASGYYAMGPTNPQGSWDPNTSQLNERRWPARSELPTGTDTRDMMAREARREADRGREDFVGQGAFGTVFSDEPGLVRKEINTREGNQSDKRIKQEIDDQLFLAEAGVGPHVHSFDTAVHGDPLVKSVVMQDLRDNYSPIQGEFAEHVDDWGSPGRSTAQKRFALAHQKQMGALALKGMNLMDRHTGNLMKHQMTGRPMQLDAGIAMRVTGDQQVEALIDATVQGFRATGQYDVAEIVSDTAWDYLNGGQTRDAWDFTKEAFANLQKIKI